MKKILVASMMLLTGSFVYAQHQEVSEPPSMYKGKQTGTLDTTSLLSAFKRGKVNGHFRYFFMATDNTKELTDYYANAAGGGIRFETARFHGFRFAVSGFYTFNIGSSELLKPDTITGQPNRYEAGLFDVSDPAKKKDLNRLEEFYIKYEHRHLSVTFGRQLLNTPFINLQDGRMMPTGVEGAWVVMNKIKKTTVEGGWLYAVSPRSTTEWYNIGESIGVYPQGVNRDGTKSQYRNNIKSKGLVLIGITHKPAKNLLVRAWDVFAENVFNTAMMQVELSFPVKNNNSFLVAAQLIKQHAINNGGNVDVAKTFFEKGGKSTSFGAMASWKNRNWETSINFTRITKEGRYLLPREWGVEPFFTFLSRERNEGLGDLTALMVKVNYSIPKARVRTSLAGGYYDLPGVKNFRLNKYGLPSYIQINSDSRYSFAGLLKGLEARLLLVAKLNNGEIYKDSRYQFNKVDMMLYNFVLNYHF